MKRNCLILAVLLLGTSFTLAQIPQTMSYQGKLTDAGGVAVANGNYSLTFKLYNVSSAGSALWTEIQPSVAVNSGIFNVTLGSVTPFGLPFDIQYWLGIAVAAGAELSPRTALTSSPYAISSLGVSGTNNIFSPSNNVGIGTTSPSYKLTLKGSGNEVYSVMSEDGTQTPDNLTVQIAPGGGTSTTRIGYLMGNFGNTTSGFLIANTRSAPLRFATGGGGSPIERMRIDNLGNVGIGTSSIPAAVKLDVAGRLRITQSSADFGLEVANTLASSIQPAGQFWTAGQGPTLNVDWAGTVSTDLATFKNYGNIVASIKTSGGAYFGNSVGIGTTSPGYQLEVAGTIGGGNDGSATPRIAYGYNANASGGFGAMAVGYNATASGTVAMALGQSVTASGYSSTAMGQGITVSGANSFGISLSGIASTITAANTMAIMGGNVGIGTTSPARRLDVRDGSGVGGYGGAIQVGAQVASVDPKLIYFGDANYVSIGENVADDRMELTASTFLFNTGSVGIGVVPSGYKLQVNGSVAGIGAYTALSDMRYKKNIQHLSGALSSIKKLHGVSFDWKQTEFPDLNFERGPQLGFIAQEVKEVLPEVVKQDDNGYYSIAYSNIIPVLVEAVKELDGKNKDLTMRNEKLEARLVELETIVKSLAATKANGSNKSVGELRLEEKNK